MHGFSHRTGHTLRVLLLALILSFSKAEVSQASFYAEYAHYPKVIRINTFAERLSYYEYGKKLGTMTVSTGNENHPTPLGRFRVLSKSPRMLSKSAGLYMPYWMEFLDGKYGIHALPENAQGEPTNTATLGDEAGGGCVRLSKQDAEKLYAWAEPGTYVLIGYDTEEYASPQQDPEVIRRYFRLINASDYAGAYALRANRTISFNEFEEMYRNVAVRIRKIEPRDGKYMVETSISTKVGSSQQVLSSFQISLGKIMRSYVVKRFH